MKDRGTKPQGPSSGTYGNRGHLRLNQASAPQRDDKTPLYRAALESSTDGIAILDKDEIYVWANDAHAKIYGFSHPDELIGLSWKSLYSEDEGIRLEREALTSLNETGMWKGEATARRLDGSAFLQELSVSAFEDGYVRVVRDITERKRAEAVLRETNAKLNALLQAIPDMVFFKDIEGRHIYLNRAFEAASGISLEEARGRTNRELLPPGLAERCNRSDEKTMLSDKPLRFEEKTGEGPDARIMETIKSPFFDECGNLAGLVGVSRDITEQRHFDIALAESEDRLASVLDSLDAIVYAADMKTHEILYINKYTRDLMGDIKGGTCWKALQKGQDGPCGFCTNDRLVDTEGNPTGVYLWEFRNTRTGRWFSIRDRAIRWVDGSLVRLEIATDITDRKRMEERLSESEKKYRDLVELSNDIIYLSDSSGNQLYMNDAAYRMLGAAPKEVIGRPWSDWIHPDDRERTLEKFTEMTQKGVDVFDFENRYVSKGGRVINAMHNVRVLRNENGDIVGAQGIARDITERKQIEDNLKLFSEAVENGPDGIQIVDLDGFIIYSNRAVTEIYGFTNAELRNKHVSDLNVDPDFAEAEILPGLRNTGRWTGELMVKHKEGFHFPIWLTASLVRNDIGLPLALVGIIRNISERKQIEEELQRHRGHLERLVDERTSQLRLANMKLQEEISERREVEKRLQEALLSEKKEKATTEAIISAIGDGICIMDRDFLVIYQNDVSRSFIGDIAGRYCHRALRDRESPCEACPVEMSFKDGKPHNAERTLSTETGILHFEVTTSPLRDSDGNIIAGIEVARDVTYRKKMEKEILKADKLESLGILAGGIAHDFNNLLTAIIGNISVASLYAGKDGKIHRRLAEAEKASIRAKDLTQQLLTFSRGGEPVKRRTLLNDLLRETAGFVLRGSRSRCEYVIPDDLWHVEADEGQISQVINNLLINADQAMPGGGTIILRAENVFLGGVHGLPLGQGRHMKISIEDHGVGISAFNLAKIFDPFFTTKSKGSGLGLATAYAITKKHGGHIEVESIPGSKTTFCVYLPACGEGAPPQPVEEPSPCPGSGRILVMDDEPSVREATSQMLTALGYQVALAADGALAVELYRKGMDAGRPFDAVIMDLTVPGGMGGMEALRRLRELDSGVRALITSGYSTDPVMAESKKHGFMGVVAKPYRIEDISKALHGVLAQRP